MERNTGLIESYQPLEISDNQRPYLEYLHNESRNDIQRRADHTEEHECCEGRANGQLVSLHYECEECDDRDQYWCRCPHSLIQDVVDSRFYQPIKFLLPRSENAGNPTVLPGEELYEFDLRGKICFNAEGKGNFGRLTELSSSFRILIRRSRAARDSLEMFIARRERTLLSGQPSSRTSRPANAEKPSSLFHSDN